MLFSLFIETLCVLVSVSQIDVSFPSFFPIPKSLMSIIQNPISSKMDLLLEQCSHRCQLQFNGEKDLCSSCCMGCKTRSPDCGECYSIEGKENQTSCQLGCKTMNDFLKNREQFDDVESSKPTRSFNAPNSGHFISQAIMNGPMFHPDDSLNIVQHAKNMMNFMRSITNHLMQSVRKQFYNDGIHTEVPSHHGVINTDVSSHPRVFRAYIFHPLMKYHYKHSTSDSVQQLPNNEFNEQLNTKSDDSIIHSRTHPSHFTKFTYFSYMPTYMILASVIFLCLLMLYVVYSLVVTIRSCSLYRKSRYGNASNDLNDSQNKLIISECVNGDLPPKYAPVLSDTVLLINEKKAPDA